MELLTGALIGISYMTIGIGVARACARIAERDFRLFDVFFWPVAVCVVAFAGETT